MGIIGLTVLTENQDLRLWGCGLKPRPCQEYFNPGLQKINKAPISQGDSNLQWPQASMNGLYYKGVDRALPLHKPILHKMVKCIGRA